MTNQHSEPVTATSADINEERLAQLRQLFPEAFTEGKVDFGKLRATLGDLVDDRPERYSFSWAGKQDAIRILQTPTSATLIPAPDESVDFNNTQNIFIEGDNLEVLKLLYKSYFGRVKIIYIDPPYNTGNDFIYPDNYADPLDTYLELTGQKDAAGNLLTTNSDTSGRYHSAWLNMMYPRLFLARQLLNDCGAIFISIGDQELHNLVQLMNELFGEENLLGIISRVMKTASNKGNHFAPSVDYVLCYAKNIQFLGSFSDEVDKSLYKKRDELGYYRDDVALYQAALDTRPNQRYFIECPDGTKVVPPGKTVPPAKPQSGDGVWRWTEDTLQKNKHLLVFKRSKRSPLITAEGKQAKYNIYTKSYLKDRQETGTVPRNFVEGFINRKGADYLKTLDIRFSYSKPVELVRWLLYITNTSDNDIVLDFFAGSATTADAVLRLNREDDASRRFIMIQIPEALDKEDFANVAEIGKERVRRVINQMKSEDEGKLPLETRDTPEDLGFKVFKLAPSNFRAWQGTTQATPTEFANQMELFNDPLVEGWRPETIIYEVALKEGYSLNCYIQRTAVAGHEVYRVADQEKEQHFYLCLESQISENIPAKLGLDPQALFVCRDIALDDTLAANLALQCRLKTI